MGVGRGKFGRQAVSMWRMLLAWWAASTDRQRLVSVHGRRLSSRPDRFPSSVILKYLLAGPAAMPFVELCAEGFTDLEGITFRLEGAVKFEHWRGMSSVDGNHKRACRRQRGDVSA